MVPILPIFDVDSSILQLKHIYQVPLAMQMIFSSQYSISNNNRVSYPIKPAYHTSKHPLSLLGLSPAGSIIISITKEKSTIVDLIKPYHTK
jgi:hypothetical protein